MTTGPYSGEDVVKVLVNNGPFELVRRSGSHAQLRWEPPDSHDSDARTVTVPMHDELRTGTLQSIAEQAGAKHMTEFLEWLDRNR
ncbi:type II toxin-antitoxin system HicA family toxin [Halobaculum lipolyticum]|uniref:Type II toxin-antitoxin system HicA family toxin n=1 Tax=Halobaculum lipolyticum TaxID=3032001 RepID=A0ABD5WJC4_9EURY